MFHREDVPTKLFANLLTYSLASPVNRRLPSLRKKSGEETQVSSPDFFLREGRRLYTDYAWLLDKLINSPPRSGAVSLVH